MRTVMGSDARSCFPGVIRAMTSPAVFLCIWHSDLLIFLVWCITLEVLDIAINLQKHEKDASMRIGP
jgi:hypothetical protein